MKRSEAQAGWSWREVINLTPCWGTDSEWESNSCSPLCIHGKEEEEVTFWRRYAGMEGVYNLLYKPRSSLCAADAEVCF